MAFNLGDIIVRLKADTSDFDSGMASAQNSGKQMSQTFMKIGATMAVVGAGITLFAKNATDYTVDLVKNTNKLSRETGLATDQASRLIYVTNRLGIDSDQASVSFGIFSKKINETSNAANPAKTAIGSLGVKVREADGRMRSFDDILLDVSDKFKGMPDGPRKTALALDLFGRSGKDMIKVLNLGSQGIRELEKRADELGLTLTAKTVASVAKYITSQKDLKDSTNSLKMAIGQLTIPVLTSFNQHLNSILTTLLNSSGPFRGVIAYVGAFGGPILSAAGGVIAFGAGLVQMTGSLNIAALAVKAFQVAIGPVGWVLLGITTIVTGLFWILGRHKKATDDSTNSSEKMKTANEDLTDTLDAQARSLDYLTQSTNALKQAQFDAEGSALDVEAAQKNYNEAVAQYGPKALEARQAHHQLREAKMRLKEAQDKVKASQELVNSVEGQFRADTPRSLNAIRLRVEKFAGLAGMIKDSIGSVIRLDQVIRQKVPSLQGSVANLQGSVARLQAAASNLQSSSGVKLQGGNVQIQGSRAGGGPVNPFSTYLVGEQGRELFIPSSGGTIIPTNVTEKVMKNSGNNVNKTNIYGDINIDSPADADYFFKRLDRNSQLERMGLSPI